MFGRPAALHAALPRAIASLTTFLLLAGCGNADPVGPSPAPPTPAPVADSTPVPPTTGTVQGVVRAAPGITDEMLPTKASDGCPAGAPAGTRLLDGERGLADAIVLLRRGPRQASAPPIEDDAPETASHTIDLRACALQTKAVVARLGDTLLLHNADDRFHALAWSQLDGGQARRVQTLPLAPKERDVRFTLSQPGFYSLASDQLPWMRGLVLVLRADEAGAVTEADGGFRLDDLAGGSWNATVRHESLGAKDTTVEVVAIETAALYEVLGAPIE